MLPRYAMIKLSMKRGTKMFLENKVVIEINTKIRIREPTDKEVTEEMIKAEVEKVVRPLFEVKENDDKEFAKVNIKIKKHKLVKEKGEK